MDFTADSYCDDGGPGADYSLCPLGHDCADCGSRMTPPAPPAPPPRPPAPPPPPPKAPSGVSRSLTQCFEFCETHVCFLGAIATLTQADVIPVGPHAVSFLSAVEGGLAVGATSLPTIVSSAGNCTYGSYSYSYSYSYDGSYPVPPAPPAPPPDGTVCYGPDYQPIAGCDCHDSCATCGFSAWPSDKYDCVTCASGGEVTPVHPDGTGYCPNPGQPLELLYGCYAACEAADTYTAANALVVGLCQDTCVNAPQDGWCDDGGPGADYFFCAIGSDCTDCGVRYEAGTAPEKGVPSAPPVLSSPPPSPIAADASVSCSPLTPSDGNVAGCHSWCALRPTDHCLRCDCQGCALCTPPSSPAPSPPSSGHAAVVTLVVQGSPSDYDAVVVADLKRRFAQAASVDESDVSVTVEAASVRLTVTIATARASASDAVVTSLSPSLADASTASAFLGVTVEATPVVEKVAPDPSPPPPKQDDSTTLYIIIGCVVGGVVLLVVIAVIVFCLCRKQNKAKVSAGP